MASNDARRSEGKSSRKVALVTGGTTGIGQATALRLAENGMSVVVTRPPGDPHPPDHALNDWGVLVEEADVRSREQMQSVVQRCVAEFGGLDVAIANAGVGTPGTVAETTDQDWSHVLDVNLYGSFLTTQLAAQVMMARRSGRIILISSTNSFWVEGGMAAYNVSKAGVAALARTASVELAAYGITVNAVAPGLIETAMTRFIREDPGLSDRYLGLIPTGRFGSPGDVAAIVQFLASDDAGWMTGDLIVVDGGQTSGLNL